MFFRGLTLSAHVFEKECKPLSNGIRAIVAKVMKFNVSFNNLCLKVSTVYSTPLVIY